MVSRRTFKLGQLRVEFAGATAVIHGPGGDSPECEIESNEDALRRWVRHDDAGRYRPLPGATNLPSGWRIRCSPALPLAAALEIVYPLAMVHAGQHRAGTLRAVRLQTVLERQSGRYARAVTLPAEAREVAANVLCGRCVRRPLWRDIEPEGEDIPCPEPCSVMVSLCRDAAGWESNRPPSVAVDPGLQWAAFDMPGNVIREHYLAERFDGDNPVGLSDG